MEPGKTPSIAERMQAVTRDLIESGLVDRQEAARKYAELESKSASREQVDVNVARENTRKALAAARERLANISSNDKTE